MHLRTSTKRQGTKTYRYVQIVQSCWRNGVSTQKVLGNLGTPPTQTVENLKLALRAAREGKALVVADKAPGLSEPSKVEANLRYLDLAVMLEVWRNWGLSQLLVELLPPTESAAAPADVVTILTLQRCVAPGSKLYAQRWFPTTALPELLGVSPKQFNNTRVHRLLDELHAVSPQLQQRLPAMYEEHGEASSALFIDVTDTWFEGRGCEMAQRNRTKAGHRNKWTIGIVLLSNEQGYPLRWQVMASKTKDHIAMGEMVESIKNLDWVQGLPFVCDRAMGRESSLRKLLASGLRFLTAAPVNSIESYTTELPYQAFSGLALEGTEASQDKDVELVVKKAREIELEEVDEDLFILGLGVVEFQWQSDKKQAKKKSKRGNKDRQDVAEPPPGRLHLLAYFNPQMFVDQRRRAQEHLAELNRFVEELNQELAQAGRGRKEETTRRKIIRRLEKHDYCECFDVLLDPIQVITKCGSKVDSFRCRLDLKPDQWKRRRRYDGFVLLLGHPDLALTGKKLALLYRAKDIIEKDFQCIKSLIKLRPIYHHTDSKVLAHVDICMLALIPQRALEHRLRRANVALSTQACLEIMSTCHLNRMEQRIGSNAFYSVTKITTAQHEILQALNLGHLVDDSTVARTLTPIRI